MNSTNTESDVARRASPYEMIGGEAMVRRLADRFYDIMDTASDTVRIRAMHAADLSPMRIRLFEFLSGWLGGPQLYYRRPDAKCIMSAHHSFAIGEAERDEWLLCMRRALEDCSASEELRQLLDTPFRRMAEALRNR